MQAANSKSEAQKALELIDSLVFENKVDISQKVTATFPKPDRDRYATTIGIKEDELYWCFHILQKISRGELPKAVEGLLRNGDITTGNSILLDYDKTGYVGRTNRTAANKLKAEPKPPQPSKPAPSATKAPPTAKAPQVDTDEQRDVQTATKPPTKRSKSWEISFRAVQKALSLASQLSDDFAKLNEDEQQVVETLTTVKTEVMNIKRKLDQAEVRLARQLTQPN